MTGGCRCGRGGQDADGHGDDQCPRPRPAYDSSMASGGPRTGTSRSSGRVTSSEHGGSISMIPMGCRPYSGDAVSRSITRVATSPLPTTRVGVLSRRCRSRFAVWSSGSAGISSAAQIQIMDTADLGRPGKSPRVAALRDRMEARAMQTSPSMVEDHQTPTATATETDAAVLGENRARQPTRQSADGVERNSVQPCPSYLCGGNRPPASASYNGFSIAAQVFRRDHRGGRRLGRLCARPLPHHLPRSPPFVRHGLKKDDREAAEQAASFLLGPDLYRAPDGVHEK